MSELRIDELRGAEGYQEFHPGYHARQLHINTASGVYNRLETIRNRMVKQSGCPAWLMVQLNEATEKLQYLFRPLEEHRDEMLPGGLLDELERLRRERETLAVALERLKRPIAAGIFGIPHEEAHRLIQEIDKTLEGGEQSE